MGLEQNCVFFQGVFFFGCVCEMERFSWDTCFVVNHNKPVYTSYVQLYPGYHNIPDREPEFGFNTFSKGYQWIFSMVVSGTATDFFLNLKIAHELHTVLLLTMTTLL